MVLISDFGHKKEDETLKDIIVNGLTNYEWQESREGRLWASDSSLCELKGVYNSNYIGSVENDALKAFYVESGIAAENVVIEGLKNSGVLLFDQYKLPPIGVNLGGYVDAIIHYKNRLWVCEVKEIGTLPSSPIESHQSQAMTYSAVTGLPALLCYIDRKISGFPRGLLQKTFELDNTYDNRYKYLVRVVKSDLYNKMQLIPPKPEYMKISYCSFCSIIDNCWTTKRDLTKDLTSGFKYSSIKQDIDIQEQADNITKQLLDRKIMRDRFSGVLKFLENNSKHEIAKKLLSGQSWDDFFYYE